MGKSSPQGLNLSPILFPTRHQWNPNQYLSLGDCICPPLQEPLLVSSVWIIFRDKKRQFVISLKDSMSPGAPTGQSKVELSRSFSVPSSRVFTVRHNLVSPSSNPHRGKMYMSDCKRATETSEREGKKQRGGGDGWQKVSK